MKDLLGIRELAPEIDYARLLSRRVTTLPNPTILANYADEWVNEYPSEIKPQLMQFGNILAVEGEGAVLASGCSYIKTHPGAEYIVNIYEDPAVAKSRFKALYGYDINDYDFYIKECTESMENLEYSARLEAEISEKRRPGLTHRLEEDTRTQSDAGVIIEREILTYNPKRRNAAQLLEGHSGIAKSAIVKTIVDKLTKKANGNLPKYGDPEDVLYKNALWGFNLIDIRAAFLDKADLMGYVHTESLRGRQVWTDSPKSELLQASTTFVITTRKYILNTPVTEENKAFIDHLYTLARTPVMFFDEINRAPQTIRDQIMIIINEHKLNNYDVSIAVKLAAANMPIGVEKLPADKQELIKYNTEDIFDKAIRNRFTPLDVSHTDPTVIDSAYFWLKKKWNGEDPKNPVTPSPLALKVIDYAYSKKYIYKLEAIDDTGKFPTFRGWDFVAQYMAWCEKTNTKPMNMVVQGLIGKQVDIGIKDLDFENSTDKYIEHCTAASIPLILLGRMGIGKTAKMRHACVANGYLLEPVDLSAQDRTTVSGFPTVEPLAHYMVPEEFHDSQAFKDYETKLLESNAPKETTVFRPNKDLWQKVIDACENGKKLVIMFDEINRCTPTVQSAVFEAISDKRLFGVPLECPGGKPIDFTVCAAGNKGEGYQVTEIDTATLHRFASLEINELNPTDLKEWKATIKDTFPFTYNLLNELGDKQLLELLNREYSKADSTLADPDLSMRTFVNLEVLYQDLFGEVKILAPDTPLPKAINIIRDPDYILRSINGDSTISIDLPDLKALYGSATMDTDNYLKKTIELLTDPTLKPETKQMVYSYLGAKDDNRYNVIRAELKGLIPQVIYPQFEKIMKDKFYSRSLATSERAKGDLASEDVEQVKLAIQDLFENPAIVEETLAGAIIELVRKQPTKISQIKRITDAYQNIVHFPFPTNKLLDLGYLSSNIIQDIALQKYSYNLPEIISWFEAETVPFTVGDDEYSQYRLTSEEDMAIILNRIIFGRAGSGSITAKKTWVPKTIKYGDRLLVDYYSVRDCEEQREFTFDSSVWRADYDGKNIIWNCKYILWDFTIKCPVQNKTCSGAAELTLDKNNIVHSNISILEAAANTIKFYEGRVENLPSDVMDLDKLSKVTTALKSIDPNAGAQVAAAELGRAQTGALEVNLFQKIWPNIERIFISVK